MRVLLVTLFAASLSAQTVTEVRVHKVSDELWKQIEETRTLLAQLEWKAEKEASVVSKFDSDGPGVWFETADCGPRITTSARWGGQYIVVTTTATPKCPNTEDLRGFPLPPTEESEADTEEGAVQ